MTDPTTPTTPAATTPTTATPVSKYTAAKFWVSFAAAMVVTATQVFTNGQVQEVLSGVEAFLGSALVYLWPNDKAAL